MSNAVYGKRATRFKFNINVLVQNNWMENGFDLDGDKITSKLKELLPNAIENEMLVKVDRIKKADIVITSFKDQKRVGYK